MAADNFGAKNWAELPAGGLKVETKPNDSGGTDDIELLDTENDEIV